MIVRTVWSILIPLVLLSLNYVLVQDLGDTFGMRYAFLGLSRSGELHIRIFIETLSSVSFGLELCRLIFCGKVRENAAVSKWRSDL